MPGRPLPFSLTPVSWRLQCITRTLVGYICSIFSHSDTHHTTPLHTYIQYAYLTGRMYVCMIIIIISFDQIRCICLSYTMLHLILQSVVHWNQECCVNYWAHSAPPYVCPLCRLCEWHAFWRIFQEVCVCLYQYAEDDSANRYIGKYFLLFILYIVIILKASALKFIRNSMLNGIVDNDIQMNVLSIQIIHIYRMCISSCFFFIYYIPYYLLHIDSA